LKTTAKRFFFEKKNQKTFIHWSQPGRRWLHTCRLGITKKDARFVMSKEVLMANRRSPSIFDLPPDPVEEERLDQQAEAEIDAGLGVPHERVREWLIRRGKGEKIPPPT
jgi:hypothetical protein